MEAADTTEVLEPPRKFGPWQGLWLVGGYLLASFFGSVLVGLAWGISIGIQAGIHGRAPVLSKPGIGVLAWSVLTGSLCAAAWGVFYTRQRAKPLLAVGEAQGVGWRRSAAPGYATALALAIALVAVVWGLEKLIPPDVSKLTGPMEQLARSHGWPRAVFILLALVVAPPVEEFVFRGGLFASLSRFGVAAATLLTTLIFVLFHAADKIHYWPGFVDVALLSLAAIFLRLRYRSLWPAIVLHFLYNAALIFMV